MAHFNASKKSSKKTREDITSFFGSDPSNQPVIHRSFPGPAGILERNNVDVQQKSGKTSSIFQQVIGREKIHLQMQNSSNSVCRIGSAFVSSDSETGADRIFNNAAWCKLTKVFKVDSDGEMSEFLNMLNIKWVLRAAKHLESGFTVPLLMVVIWSNFDSVPAEKRAQKPYACLEIADITGTIQAIFNSSFIEEYGLHMRPGTAVSLKMCPVLKLKSHVLLKVGKENLVSMAYKVSIDDPVSIFMENPFSWEIVQKDYLFTEEKMKQSSLVVIASSHNGVQASQE